MSFNLIEFALLLGLGAGIGLLSSFVGLGGGALMVPLLPLMVPMTQIESTATSLFTIFLVALINAAKFSAQKSLDWDRALWLGGSAGIVSLGAATVAARASEHSLQIAFGIMLLFLIAFVLVERRNRDISAEDRRRHGIGPWVALGAFCGLLSGGTGVGGGLVAGPLLLRLRMAAAERVVPLINVMMLFSGAFGILGFLIQRPGRQGWRWGALWVDAAVFMLIGSQLTSPIGIKYQARVSAPVRRRLLIFLMVLIAIKVWWGVWEYGI